MAVVGAIPPVTKGGDSNPVAIHMGKQHITDNPVKTTGTPSTVNPSLAEIARGQAVAALLVKAAQEHGNYLKRFLMDIVQLSQNGRSGFRVAVSKHLRDIRRHVNAVKGTPEYAAYAAAARSAGVRLSEAVTFSKAVDAGFMPNFEGIPYHSMIGSARTMLASESAVGPTQKRGRKATSAVDKAIAYIAKLGLKKADLVKVEAVVHDMATGKPAPATAPTAVSNVVAMPKGNSAPRGSLSDERAAAKGE